MRIEPTSSTLENIAFKNALAKVLSVSHAEMQKRLAEVRNGKKKSPRDTPSVKGRATGDVSR